MMKRKYKKSTIIPILLIIYLVAMSYIGFDIFRQGNYLYYFGIIGITLVIILLLHFSLKRKERLAEERESDTKPKDKE
ncbi:MAG: hypothetical protein PHR45_04620 [Muribaculaceae bacterium]|nr:hypothetical protein [Muribaculaceae bacterium]